MQDAQVTKSLTLPPVNRNKTHRLLTQSQYSGCCSGPSSLSISVASLSPSVKCHLSHSNSWLITIPPVNRNQTHRLLTQSQYSGCCSRPSSLSISVASLSPSVKCHLSHSNNWLITIPLPPVNRYKNHRLLTQSQYSGCCSGPSSLSIVFTPGTKKGTVTL